MKAVVLVKTGTSGSFEIREVATPVAKPGEVLIKVEAFGLNFADVMARKGMYQDAPPLPSILGYDVAGTVDAVGTGVTNVKPGDKVTAMTRFGGYAEYAITDARAIAIIPASMDSATATALTTQYCTAYFAAAEMVNLHKGDKVLIQSGAGGVGTALIQFARYKGCEIFSTAGSEIKLNYLRAQGVQHPINYTTQDFETAIKDATGGKGVDVIFDAVGGKYVKKGFRSLASGGRLLCYGAADMSDKNIFGKIKAGLDFGIYHPAMFMMNAKSMLGVNMLRIADNKPEVLQRCLGEVVRLTTEGVFTPTLGKVFPVAAIDAAHQYLETRQSMGKVAVTW
jgi:NADPH:quinone reductase-like Zn-dependent oxidoreductase